MSERRKEQRLAIRLEVELKCEGLECFLHSKDLSSSGVFLEKQDDCLPEVGSIVQIRVKQDFADGLPPMVRAKVVRIEKDGVALEFIDE